MGITNELPDQLSRMQGPSPGQLPPILRAVPESKPLRDSGILSRSPSIRQRTCCGALIAVVINLSPSVQMSSFVCFACTSTWALRARCAQVCVGISHCHGRGVLCQAAGVECSMSPLGIGGVPRRAHPNPWLWMLASGRGSPPTSSCSGES
eukprot:662974-Amphidinium_carterae.1